MKTALVLALLVAAFPAWADTISACKYTSPARDVVNCTVGGVSASIPAAPGNRHWDQIVKDKIRIADPD